MDTSRKENESHTRMEWWARMPKEYKPGWLSVSGWHTGKVFKDEQGAQK